MSIYNDKFTIYALEFNPTKKLYIGCTTNIRKRYLQHIKDLSNGKHRSKELQDDYNKYGEDFSIYILEEFEDGNNRICLGSREITISRAKEYEWMNKYGTTENGYNLQDWQARRSIQITAEREFPLKEGRPPLPQ